jgi:multidrug transporter EmrE-like cation transporter
MHVTLSIYNSMGQEVSKLVSQDMSVGVHTAIWNASGFASGVYYYRIIAGNFIETKKLLLLK